MGCRNLFLEISTLSGCLRVSTQNFCFVVGHYRGQTRWISFQTCCSDMSQPVSQNHTCLRPQAPRDLFSCGVRPPGFYGDKILGLTLPCMSNPYAPSSYELKIGAVKQARCLCLQYAGSVEAQSRGVSHFFNPTMQSTKAVCRPRPNALLDSNWMPVMLSCQARCSLKTLKELRCPSSYEYGNSCLERVGQRF